MLDHVEGRRFLVKPARKDALPLAVGPLDVDLDEGAGQLFQFPGRRRFAGPQANDDIFHPHRLAGLQGQIADDAVAFVEQADHGGTFRHWRHARLVDPGPRNVGGHRISGRKLVGLAAAGGCSCEKQ